MDNTETTKPQQTGGLKLMTVFIAVLALHVLVIGGFTVYHLMGSGGDTDVALDKTHVLKADGTSVAEVAAPETTPADKPADAPAPAPVDSTTPAPAPAATTTTTTLTNASTEPTPSAPVTISANPTPTPAPAPAPTPTPNPNAPLTITAPQIAQIAQDAQTVTEASSLAPPPEPVPAELAPSSVPIKPATAPVSTPKISPTTVATTAAAASTAATSPEAAPAANTESPSTLALGPVHMPAANAKPALASTEEHVAARERDAKHEFYTVKITDSYKKIARAHHITVAELKAANHIHDNVLHTGQKLIIPLEKSAVVKEDATPETGTASHVVLNESSSTASLSAEPTPTMTHHARHHLYTVEKGDTLKKIAQKFNTTTLALKEANNLRGTKLVAGEKLKIPTKEARSAALNPPAPLTPVPTPAQPNQVETQPTPIAPAVQPAAAPAPNPEATPPSSPELANLTF